MALPIRRYGLPECAGTERRQEDRTYFVLCYDSPKKVAAWTAHEIRPERLPVSATRSGYFRQGGGLARNEDYRGSGYSRGHLVPAEDLSWSEAAVRSTYMLLNAAPQLQCLNAGVWRELAVVFRTLAARSEAAYIVTGPMFEGEATTTIGRGQVAVPTHFFKVILLIEGHRKSTYAAIVPNSAPVRGMPVESFAVTIDEVERRTGLSFFPLR